MNNTNKCKMTYHFSKTDMMVMRKMYTQIYPSIHTAHNL